MRLKFLFILLLESTLLLAVDARPAYENNFTIGALKPQSFSKLAFGPDAILFIGDSLGARICAVDLNDSMPVSDPQKLNVLDLEAKIADTLGIDSRDVLIHDMAVNPISKNIYLTVSRGRRNFSGK